MTMPLERDSEYLSQRRLAISLDAQQIGIDYATVSQPDGEPWWEVGLYFIPAAPIVLDKAILPAPLPRPEQVSLSSVSGLAGASIVVLSVAQNEAATALVVRLGYGPATIQGMRELPRYVLKLEGVDNLDPFFDHVTFSLSSLATLDLQAPRGAPGVVNRPPAPTINYLARDYPALRELMLNRLSLLMPGWTESSPTDLGVTVVEALAYAADQFSYYQDAVATEAYLVTARQRVSIRRHARLLDYSMHEGCNARVWVHFEVNRAVDLHASTPLLTEVQLSPATGAALSLAEYRHALSAGARVFETICDTRLWPQHNSIDLYTWGTHDYTLEAGATSAYLVEAPPGGGLALGAGDVLVFQQVRSLVADSQADPTRCHAVRLTEVQSTSDPLGGRFQTARTPGASTDIPLVKVSWALADALPFAFPVSVRQGSDVVRDISVARGNNVLADHGFAVDAEALPEVTAAARYRAQLQETDLTFREPYDDLAALMQPAMASLAQDPCRALPVVRLTADDEEWRPRADLLGSSWFSRDFVVEMDNLRTAHLRFGDGTYGERPSIGTQFIARYRVGNGTAGNVGSGTIVSWVPSNPIEASAITSLSNLVPAVGGIDAEPIEQVKLNAPRAFQSQDRCVTDDDYAAIARRHADVRDARASQVWTGSWPTVLLAVVRHGNRPVDAAFTASLAAFMQPYLLIGTDLSIEPPRWVALEIEVAVHVAPGHLATAVEQTLLEAFSDVLLPDGRRGFFYPDAFGFGQAVYVSQVVAVALHVPGVAWVEVTRFGRWSDRSTTALDSGYVAIGPTEIARLDNDPNAPQNGRISFDMVAA